MSDLNDKAQVQAQDGIAAKPAYMDFPEAFILMQAGMSMRRRGWNAPDQWVRCQFPDEKSRMTQPYLYLHNNLGQLFPWFPSNGDLFATDWETV